MAKFTKSSFKKFIKDNRSKLLVWQKSSFDGMVDGVVSTGNTGYTPAANADYVHENNFGIQGVWLVGGSRDYFTPFEDDAVRGVEVYNCCGKFRVAVAK